MILITEHTDKFRVFINLSSSACESQCIYCYVPEGAPQPYLWGNIEIGLRNLVTTDSFLPGKNGTIITFGGHTEIFRSSQLIDLLIGALKFICPLGNPVQISTKQFVNAKTINAINRCSHYPGQIALFVSCASVTNAKLVEPGTDSPTNRWLTFTNQQATRMPRALFIKPWLGNTTKQDLHFFAKLAIDYDLNAVCLGPLYVTQKIHEALSEIDLDKDGSYGIASHPLIVEPHTSITPQTTVLSEFREQLGQIPLFSSSICISAHFAQVACPLHGQSGCNVASGTPLNTPTSHA